MQSLAKLVAIIACLCSLQKTTMAKCKLRSYSIVQNILKLSEQTSKYNSDNYPNYLTFEDIFKTLCGWEAPNMQGYFCFAKYLHEQGLRQQSMAPSCINSISDHHRCSTDSNDKRQRIPWKQNITMTVALVLRHGKFDVRCSLF